MNQIVRPLILLILGILIGYSGSRFLNTNQSLKVEENISTENIDLQKIREQLQFISDSDLKEYLNLKDQKEKYLKANDILGKIMVIFLADLGLRVSQMDVEELFKLSENQEEEDVKELHANENKTSSNEKTKNNSLEKPIVQQSGDQNSEDWKKAEEKLSEVSSDREIEEFLKKVEIKDFFNQIASAQIASRQSLRKINGRFTGQLNFDDPQREDADVNMEIDAAIENGEIRGSHKVAVSRDGEVFSSSNGNGTLQGFKNINGSKEALFIDLGGKSGFVQIYFKPDGNSAFGLYYNEVSIGKMVKAGTIRLQKH